MYMKLSSISGCIVVNILLAEFLVHPSFTDLGRCKQNKTNKINQKLRKKRNWEEILCLWLNQISLDSSSFCFQTQQFTEFSPLAFIFFARVEREDRMDLVRIVARGLSLSSDLWSCLLLPLLHSHMYLWDSPFWVTIFFNPTTHGLPWLSHSVFVDGACWVCFCCRHSPS